VRGSLMKQEANIAIEGDGEKSCQLWKPRWK
jgi:hypothetical protein